MRTIGTCRRTTVRPCQRFKLHHIDVMDMSQIFESDGSSHNRTMYLVKGIVCTYEQITKTGCRLS